MHGGRKIHCFQQVSRCLCRPNRTRDQREQRMNE
jgi:hypothetical protein